MRALCYALSTLALATTGHKIVRAGFAAVQDDVTGCIVIVYRSQLVAVGAQLSL